VGENVKLIDDNTTIDQIKKDGVGYDEVWLFRANVNEGGDIINYENISKITKHSFDDILKKVELEENPAKNPINI